MFKSGNVQFETYHQELLQHESHLTSELNEMGIIQSDSISTLTEISKVETESLKQTLTMHSNEMRQLLQDQASFVTYFL